MSDYMDYLAKGVGYTSYNAYLKSEHWRIFSDGMRRKKCFVCGRNDVSLQVHHTTYERLGAEWPTDVITVCNGCHEDVHKLVKKGTSLENAHYALMTSNHKKAGGKERRTGRFPGKTNKPWVHWRDLCNVSFRETPKDVFEFLLAGGHITEDQHPTERSLRRRFARIHGGKVLWRKARYISLRREERRATKRTENPV